MLNQDINNPFKAQNNGYNVNGNVTDFQCKQKENENWIKILMFSKPWVLLWVLLCYIYFPKLNDGKDFQTN